MATVSVDVDVNLEDFDTDDILDELKYRYKRDYDCRLIDEFMQNLRGQRNRPESISLLDQIKIDFVINNLDKIKLTDLENLI